MIRLRFALLSLLLLAGCGPQEEARPGGTKKSLAEARKGFTTKLVKQVKSGEPVEEPPVRVFRKVQYDAPVGKCAAYLTPDAGDGKKRPAIVWITGGDCNTIGDVWSPAKPNNDQTARQYREAGIVMMFPSLRGGNQNPGSQENFFGEVDDVIAAANFLAKQPHVDPDRIYLGGHSTGGTLALLVAALTDRFRAVFSFGPVYDVRYYPAQFTAAINLDDDREARLRSPGRWLDGIKRATFVFEGARGNADALSSLDRNSTNSKTRFYLVRGADHFDVLAPTNRLIAQKILADEDPETKIAFTEAELNELFGK